ncbi:MAG: response regulator [Sedimentisphaerales bacterium]|nr:response regulator [Sedimentisphaerales bacterium]
MSKVLVADDHGMTRKIIRTVLEKNGYQVILAENGQEAWSLLTDSYELSLAILDWEIPGIDGVEICRKLEKEYKNRLIYTILLTAKEGSENITDALEAGANDYITKPFKKNELLARLKVGERIIALQSQLAQAHKLESIGQLASGIAHEINTPIQYIGDNINFLEEAFKCVEKVLSKHEELINQCRHDPVYEELIEEIDQVHQEANMDYISEEIPQATQHSNDGIQCISDIVRAMKEYSHPGEKEKNKADLNHSIENTITVARNKWKRVARLKTVLDPDLPLVPCYTAEINQVILNLIINAAEAIQEKVGLDMAKLGTITVSTRNDDQWVEIRVSDTGCGIPEAIRDKIFDPFFTTKEVGRGSGQGLMVCYSIITEKHGGSITFETETGKGTTFIVRLPVEVQSSPQETECIV